MTSLRKFEREAIRLLGTSTHYSDTLISLVDSGIVAEYKYTGVGYFLTIKSPELPLIREVLTEPSVVGELAGILCSFIAFVEDHSLTLECYTWVETGIPQDFRDQDIVLRIERATDIAHSPSNP